MEFMIIIPYAFKQREIVIEFIKSIFYRVIQKYYKKSH